MKKFVAEKDGYGNATGKYVQADAGWVDVINPTVPVDSSTSIARSVLFALVGSLVR